MKISQEIQELVIFKTKQIIMDVFLMNLFS